MNEQKFTPNEYPASGWIALGMYKLKLKNTINRLRNDFTDSTLRELEKEMEI